MTILIDDRAGSRDLIRHPPLDSPDPNLVTLCRLTSADVCFTGNGPTGPLMVGVEVKSISDFLSSTRNGRLASTQLTAMIEDYRVRWLLLYGTHRCGRWGRLEILQEERDPRPRCARPRESTEAAAPLMVWNPAKIGAKEIEFATFKKWLCAISTQGFTYDHVHSPAEAAVWLHSLYTWWQKPWHQHDLFRTFDNSRTLPLIPNLSPAIEARAIVAAKLPARIGFKMALAAARHFPSIRAMVNATAQEWAEVVVENGKPGGRSRRIGIVLGRAIEESVSREQF